ncbi:ABC transporter permease [Amycolatopsis pigmentata]|uniref:ABC transporter permease n=1 Tax=Amycolatopsis pigmentata TaxID=450801 RepID=A0ABW5FKG3_9PSEU
MRPSAIGRRLVSGVLVLVGVSILAFSLVHLLPGDSANAIAGEFASPDQIENVRTQLGLDKPIVVQYFTWLTSVLHGDFGTSLWTSRPAKDMVLDAVPATLSIALVSLLISTVLGLFFGTIAALRRGSWVDRGVTFCAGLGISMPAFWVLLILFVPLSILNRWFPAVGYAPLSAGFWPWLSHILLPATALAVAHAAELSRFTRGAVMDVLSTPYIRASRSRGASGWRLVRTHVLRNAAIPVVTVFGLQIGNMLGGVIVVETVAGINGLGLLAVNAILNRDFVLVQAYVLFTAAVVVVINILVDLLYSAINPKVRA